jgi:hypothetical protein
VRAECERAYMSGKSEKLVLFSAFISTLFRSKNNNINT